MFFLRRIPALRSRLGSWLVWHVFFSILFCSLVKLCYSNFTVFCSWSCCQDSNTPDSTSDSEPESPLANKEQLAEQSLEHAQDGRVEDEEAVEATHCVFLADTLCLHIRLYGVYVLHCDWKIHTGSCFFCILHTEEIESLSIFVFNHISNPPPEAICSKNPVKQDFVFEKRVGQGENPSKTLSLLRAGGPKRCVPSRERCVANARCCSKVRIA